MGDAPRRGHNRRQRWCALRTEGSYVPLRSRSPRLLARAEKQECRAGVLLLVPSGSEQRLALHDGQLQPGADQSAAEYHE
jgi:hypothetical protein